MTKSEVCKERIISEDYMDFINTKDTKPLFSNISAEELCEQKINEEFRSIYVYRPDAEPLRLERYDYYSIPNCYTLLDMEALHQAGISQIQNYPTLQLKGENILMGFIDTGIDYQNSVFRNLDGSTRIAGIWDQTVQSGMPPEGLLYGTEYTEEQINEALFSQEENPETVVSTVDANGHGTFVASVAAGGADIEAKFLGAAPESTIGMVKLKPAKEYLKKFYFIREDAVCYQENDIMLGLRYLNQLAKKRNLPLVLCIALGTNMGGHTSSSPLSVLLDKYANMRNRVVVVGGGNEANQRHHYYGKIEKSTGKKEVEIRVGNNSKGFVLEFWTDVPNLFAVSLISPSGEKIPRIPLRQGGSGVYNFVFEETQVSIDYRLLVERTNSELIFFRFDRPTEGIWKVILDPFQLADGVFHGWLPMKEFQSGEVYFIESNPYYTITEPSTALASFTVACANGSDNSIDINSGRGYTRSERVKPDLSAPGVRVTGALPGGRFVERTGSSAAVGIAAGACALLLEWLVYQVGQSNTDSLQVKNLLIIGAIRKPEELYPNRETGFGALNLYNTFETVRKY